MKDMINFMEWIDFIFYVKILKIYRELINRYTSLKLKDFRFLISEVLYCTEVCVLVLTYFCLFPSSRGWVDVFAGSSGVSSSLVMSSSVVTPSWVSSCSRLRFCHRTCSEEERNASRISFYLSGKAEAPEARGLIGHKAPLVTRSLVLTSPF